MRVEIAEVATRVRAAYAPEQLRVLNEARLSQVGVLQPDVGFLCTVGVPRAEQLEISFNLADELPTLKDYLKRKGKRQPNQRRDIICLDEKYDIVVGIDMEHGGNVIWIDLAQELTTRFINTSVACLVGFMAECVLHWRRWTEQEIPEAKSLNEACDWMRRLDPPAVQPETFWSLVLDEMEPR